MQLPDPTHMDLNDWADATTQIASLYALVFQLQEQDWQSWGLMFLSSPALGSLNPPNPYDYGDWREWAQKLCVTMGNATGAEGPGVR